MPFEGGHVLIEVRLKLAFALARKYSPSHLQLLSSAGMIDLDSRERGPLGNAASHGKYHFISTCSVDCVHKKNKQLLKRTLQYIPKWLLNSIAQGTADIYLRCSPGSSVVKIPLRTKYKISLIPSVNGLLCNIKLLATVFERGDDDSIEQSSSTDPETTSPSISITLDLSYIWKKMLQNLH